MQNVNNTWTKKGNIMK